MFLGDLGLVAEIARFEGAAGLRSKGLRLLAPMKPMLAEMSEDLDEVLKEHGGTTAIEYKLDGARIQIHRKGDAIRIFSRRLSDVTNSLPEIVAIARSLPASEFLLEGEVVATDRGGKPLPFQDLMRRFRRVHEIAANAARSGSRSSPRTISTWRSWRRSGGAAAGRGGSRTTGSRCGTTRRAGSR